jgi:hypothetical protein
MFFFFATEHVFQLDPRQNLLRVVAQRKSGGTRGRKRFAVVQRALRLVAGCRLFREFNAAESRLMDNTVRGTALARAAAEVNLWRI